MRKIWRFGYWHTALKALFVACQVAVVTAVGVGVGFALSAAEPVTTSLLWSASGCLFFGVPVAVVARSRRRNFVEIDSDAQVVRVRRAGVDEKIPFDAAEFRIPRKASLPNPPFLECRINGVRDIELPFLQQGMYVTPRRLASFRDSLDRLNIAWSWIEKWKRQGR